MKVKTLRVKDKLIILDGKNPMMYVDLTSRKLVKYKKPKLQVLKEYLKKCQSSQ